MPGRSTVRPRRHLLGASASVCCQAWWAGTENTGNDEKLQHDHLARRASPSRGVAWPASFPTSDSYNFLAVLNFSTLQRNPSTRLLHCASGHCRVLLPRSPKR